MESDAPELEPQALRTEDMHMTIGTQLVAVLSFTVIPNIHTCPILGDSPDQNL